MECNKTNLLVLHRGLFRWTASHVTNCFTPLPVVRIIHKHLCRMAARNATISPFEGEERRVGEGAFAELSHTVSKLQRRYYEICGASPRHFFSFVALYYPDSCVYNFCAFFIAGKKQIKMPSSADVNWERCLRRIPKCQIFSELFFHEVRNCPTITNVINVAAKRECLPFFCPPFYFAHS